MYGKILSILFFTCLVDCNEISGLGSFFGLTEDLCGENEESNGCGSPCTATCDEPHILCPAVCSGPLCHCIPGYVRNSEGKCIKLEDCPKKECPENEIWSYCGQYCRKTCELCLPICTSPGCICKEDYVRNSEGKCVEETNCS